MSTMKPLISYRDLFWSFFKINLVTFGGGFVIMPIIKKTFVEKKKLLDEAEMIDMIALAQSIPGVMAINTSMLVGHKVRGVKGALVAMVGGFLPPLIVLSIISFFYVAFQTNPIILALLRGMRGAVTAVLLVSSYSMFRSVLKADVPFALTMMTSAFLMAYFTDLSVAYLMLGAGLIGYLYYTHLKKGVNG